MILAEMLEDLKKRDPLFTALTESDPGYKILEVAAYRELLIRARINDAAKAVMLAYAGSENLDNLAALFGVTRKVIDPGNSAEIPPIASAGQIFTTGFFPSTPLLRSKIASAPQGRSWQDEITPTT